MKTVSGSIRHVYRRSFICPYSCRITPAILFLYVLIASVNIPAWGQQFSPSEWKFESQREAIAPVYYIDNKTLFSGNQTLTLEGGGKQYADGHWYKTVNVEPDKYFQFKAYFSDSAVEEPNRSILARIIWQKESGEQVGFTEYPAVLREKKENGWSIISQTYKIPAEAKQAKLELHYRRDSDGLVHFGEVSFEKVAVPQSRKVRIATINYKPRDSKSSKENLENFAELIAKAAPQKPDIVCLPEAITLCGTALTYVSASEPVPGPTTQFLGNIARKYNLYIVAGILERKGEVVYNTSVLINRNGDLIGKYHKLSLPREEIDGGITPGDSLPVFNTDFGRIGMMICWDVTFPETARALAQEGAEIIFLPMQEVISR